MNPEVLKTEVQSNEQIPQVLDQCKYFASSNQEYVWEATSDARRTAVIKVPA